MFDGRHSLYGTREAYDKSGNEKNDCAVRAIANALLKPYGEVHALLKAKGRKDRKGTMTFITADVMQANGWKRFYVRDVYKRPTMSVGRFLQRHPKGQYLVRIPNHVFTVRDGVVFDGYVSLCKRINCYWTPVA